MREFMPYLYMAVCRQDGIEVSNDPWDDPQDDRDTIYDDCRSKSSICVSLRLHEINFFPLKIFSIFLSSHSDKSSRLWILHVKSIFYKWNII